MAKKEEIQKSLIVDVNKSLSDKISLVSQLQDQMSQILKIYKEKGTLDKLSLDNVKAVATATRAMKSEYDSVKEVQKDIAKNAKLQNDLERQKLALYKQGGESLKDEMTSFKNKENAVKRAEDILAKYVKQQQLGVKGADKLVARAQANVSIQQKNYSNAIDILTPEAEQVRLLEQAAQLNEDNNQILQEQLRTRKNLENAEKGLVTLTGNLGKLFDKIGLSGVGKVFTESAEKSKKMIYEATNGGQTTISTFAKMKIAASSFGAALKVALGPMAMIGLIVSLFSKAKNLAKESGEYVKKLDQQTADFGRSLGISGRKAAALTNEARSMGAAMGMTSDMATQSAGAIYGALEGAEKVSSKTLNTFMKLNVFAGMSADNLASIYKLSKLTGQPAEKTAEAMASTARESIKANKVNISMKQVMDGVSKVSATMKLNFGGSAEGLTKAFIQSKKLGLELSKVDDIASSLLNIEDSIAAEMEAELMTGKELNLEKAREAALNNKNGELMTEIANQFGSIEEFQNMNRASQESFAKAIGMSRDGLADMLVSSKENEAKNTDLVDTQQQSLATMQSQASIGEQMAVTDEARLAAAIPLGKEQLKLEESMKRLETIGTQIISNFAAPMLEKMVAVVDKVVELIDRFKAARAEGNGIFDSITKVWQATDTFGKVLLGVVGILTTIKGIMFVVNTYQKIANGFATAKVGIQKLLNIELVKEGAQMLKNGARAALDFVKTVGTAIMKAISSLASIPVIGFGLGIAAGATIAGLAAKYMNDGVISPKSGGSGYGDRVLYGPEGAISFNNKDTIVAGTNLFGDDVMSGPTESISMGGGALLQEMKAIKAVMNQILNHEGTVYLDGSKVGKALTLSGYRM